MIQRQSSPEYALCHSVGHTNRADRTDHTQTYSTLLRRFSTKRACMRSGGKRKRAAAAAAVAVAVVGSGEAWPGACASSGAPGARARAQARGGSGAFKRCSSTSSRQMWTRVVRRRPKRVGRRGAKYGRGRGCIVCTCFVFCCVAHSRSRSRTRTCTCTCTCTQTLTTTHNDPHALLLPPLTPTPSRPTPPSGPQTWLLRKCSAC